MQLPTAKSFIAHTVYLKYITNLEFQLTQPVAKSNQLYAQEQTKKLSQLHEKERIEIKNLIAQPIQTKKRKLFGNKLIGYCQI